MVAERTSRTRESLQIEEGSSIVKKSFFARNKKPILAGSFFVVVLAAVLLGLGLGGVFDPPTSPQVQELPAEPKEARLDCKPDQTLNKEDCEKSGCVFDATDYTNQNVPRCYRDSTKNGFFKVEPVNQPAGLPKNSELYSLKPASGDAVEKVYSEPFKRPQLMVQKMSNNILRLKFSDGGADRYEVPVPLQEIKDSLPNAPKYSVVMNGDNTNGLQVVRAATKTVIFDLSLGGLFLEDQFLQITTKLPSTYVYGFGDNRHPNLRHKMDWRTWPLFSRDQAPVNPTETDNLYGVHPFYMVVEEDGNSHGVLLLNSNAMEYQFQPAPALTLRSIGGVFDFYFFMGPTPENVIQQYTELLGRTFIPPYWGLGFQISRWGYENLDHVKRVVKRNTDAGIPLDAVYGDIDYMRHRQDFTYDVDKYTGLPEYIDDLHKNGMRYVIILDPAIHVDSAIKHPSDPAYRPYLEGLEKEIFIEWPAELIANVTAINPTSVGENRIMLGKVWPDGRTAFPDFFRPSTLEWWEDMINYTYTDLNIKFDALWIDMNEVASFDTNENPDTAWYCNRPDELPGNHTCFALKCLESHPLENPPYKPMAVRRWSKDKKNPMLSDKTICMVGEVKINGKTYTQYDVHSLYGWSQAERTYQAAQLVRNERSFVFSRSTYPGGQQFVGHWLGDNAANFEELRWSLIGLLEYSMFGYSYVGADVCGFFDNTTSALCSKWHVAGAFYPFCRNHNHYAPFDQDPASPHLPGVAEVAKKALQLRYSMLPYLYTLFYRSHVSGNTVNRPLHHEYPTDKTALNTDNQFLWGPALLISPIVDEKTSREVYVPTDKTKGTFYDYYTGEPREKSYTFNWNVEKNVVALDIRSGHVIPHQVPGKNTKESRNNDFYLAVATDQNKPVAEGELYWDDGEGIDPVERGQFYLASYNFNERTLTFRQTVLNNGGPDMSKHRLTKLRFYSSVSDRFKGVLNDMAFFVDNQPVTGFTAKIEEHVLVIEGQFPMERSWTFQFMPKDVAGRINCSPGKVIGKADCEAKGCKYDERLSGFSAALPQCYFDPATQGFQVVPSKSTGNQYTLRPMKGVSISGSPQVPDIKADFIKYSKTSMRFRILDQAEERYQVPNSLMKLTAPYSSEFSKPVEDSELEYSLDVSNSPGKPFGFTIKRKSTGATIFDTSLGGFVFEEQFLQITTKLASPYVYGFGENRKTKFRHDMDWRIWPLFARDEGPIDPTRPTNHYGVHPFYIVMEEDGKAHGVFFLNSNAMEYQFQPAPALTLRSFGGIFDFFIFTGPNYDDVIKQYLDLIGHPVLPPYWALGYQICRWGYNNLDEVKDVIERTRLARIPQDIQYIELDYMDKRQMFTIDTTNFGGIEQLAAEERKNGLKFIYLLDPFIHAETRKLYPSEVGTNPSYDDGVAMDVFMKWDPKFTSHPQVDPTSIGPNNIMLGKAWPDGRSAFPDYFHPNASAWWKKWISSSEGFFKFDGLWIDMNEPVAFETNIVDPKQAWFCLSDSNLNGNHTCWGLQCPGDDPLESPPYMPVAASTWAGSNFRTLLSSKTLCMSALMRYGDSDKTTQHYNMHNLYGIQQAKVTKRIAEEVTGTRSWVIGRSTYPGSGQYSGHWLGDNKAQWSDVHYSIIGMLDFNMFGIPYVGADICGFFEDTTEELCKRWQVVGAFYPMSRNHNTRGPRAQDPAQWESVAEATRKAMEIRYELLPYLYTLFDCANRTGLPVVRPLFSEFYDGRTNKQILDIDDQFMWGSALMFAPIVQQGQKVREVFFPRHHFYDYQTNELIDGDDKSRIVAIADDGIAIYVAGGQILPVQPLRGALNTDGARKNPMNLKVYLSAENDGFRRATGELYYDDGVSLQGKEKYLRAEMSVEVDGAPVPGVFAKTTFNYKVSHNVKPGDANYVFDSIEIYGLQLGKIFDDEPEPTFRVMVNGAENNLVQVSYDARAASRMTVSLPAMSALKEFTIVIERQVPDLVDCMPDVGKIALPRFVCATRNCRWTTLQQPSCVYPSGADRFSYHLEEPYMNDGTVKLIAGKEVLGLRKDIYDRLLVKATAVNDNVLRITITERPNGTLTTERYTVPPQYAPFSTVSSPLTGNESYIFEVEGQGPREKFHPYFVVKRKGQERPIWSTDVGPLIFADQYLEISARVPHKHVYGIGEHSKDHFAHKFAFETYGMLARDQPPGGRDNLYGTHPYAMVVENDQGDAFGVLLLNSNPMEIQLFPNGIMTYRTLGGVLDFYIVVGTTGPASVTQFYTDLIGKPYLPPYWALGFQLSRYGYDTYDNMISVVKRTLDAEIPLDVFYGDIDYFEGEQNFILGSDFKDKLPQFVNESAENGLNFITILDPFLPANTSYQPFVDALAMENKEHIFLRWPEGYNDTNEQSYSSIDENEPSYLLAHVWPQAKSVFVDFFNEAGQKYWKTQVRKFHEQIAFAALWIDMNEPAAFGTNGHDVWYQYSYLYPWRLVCPADDKFENPPYKPKSLTGNRLSEKTVCMNAVQTDGEKEYIQYNVHNLYGHSQIKPSLEIMQEVTGKRSFVFSRSTFVGSGAHAGHWLGDNTGNWQQLRQSIIGMLDMNLFGIPYVGADICGYFGDAEPELCARWMQLGAFYPFSRNHNGKNNINQDPAALGETVVKASKNALEQRYRLLPYLYTLFYKANKIGGAVVESLMHVFPRDLPARTIAEQFMWGDCLMISPVLYEGARQVTAYFPTSYGHQWFDFASGAQVDVPENGWKTIDADMETIPLHVRSDCILPLQGSANNTMFSRTQPFSLWIAAQKTDYVAGPIYRAGGDLYWDDGDSIERTDYHRGWFSMTLWDVEEADGTFVKGTLTGGGGKEYSGPMPNIANLFIAGISHPVRGVVIRVDGVEDTVEPSNMAQDMVKKTLTIMNLSLDIKKNFVVEFVGK